MKRALGAALIALLTVPATADAHGLVGKADLPIPMWLFIWAAAAVLVISFAALGSCGRARNSSRTASARSRMGSRACSPAGCWRSCAGRSASRLLVMVILCGFFGTQLATQNIAPTFVYVAFWLGFVPVSVLFGDVFAAFNPWRAVGRAVGWSLRRVSTDTEPLAYPARLGYYPAALGLLAFAALELISARGDRPSTIATAAVVYSLATWIAMALYGVDTWARRGEAFGVYFNLFSKCPWSRSGAARWGCAARSPAWPG